MSSIARNVHFVAEDGSHQAAIVSAVNADGTVGLTIFPGVGVRTEPRVPRDDGQVAETEGKKGKVTTSVVHPPKTWHFPEPAPAANPGAATNPGGATPAPTK